MDPKIERGSAESEILEKENNHASAEEVINELENAYKQIPNFHIRLVYFTLKTIRTYFNQNNIRGRDSEDVVQIVIEKIISLKRKWYRDTIPEFPKFIRLSIISYIKNEKKRKEIIEPVENSDDIYDWEGNFREDLFEDLIQESLRQSYAENNFAIDFDKLLDRCYAEFEKDENVFFVFDARINGEKSNIQIAKQIGIEIKEVENALKKIKYHINKIIKKTKNLFLQFGSQLEVSND